MDQSETPGIVSDGRQRALEQNVYTGATAAKVSNDLLLSIDTHLRLIKYAAWILVACALALAIKYL
jgi:hypothetical protein